MPYLTGDYASVCQVEDVSEVSGMGLAGCCVRHCDGDGRAGSGRQQVACQWEIGEESEDFCAGGSGGLDGGCTF